MTDQENAPAPAPTDETSRLERIEARLAALEERVASVGDAFTAADQAEATGTPDETPPAWLAQVTDFVRNNPVLTLIGAIVVLVLLSHILN